MFETKFKKTVTALLAISATTFSMLGASPANAETPLAATHLANPAEQSTGITRQVAGAGTQRVLIGKILVTALSDGTLPQDLHELLRGTTASSTDEHLRKGFLVNPVEVSVNEWVFKIGERVVLVDTGSGQLIGPGYGGNLVQSLVAAGVRPEEVTDVLLTHIHTDHSGGLIRDGKMVFPKATIHVGKPDLDFFLDRKNAKKAHVDIKYFDEAIKTIKPYLDAGRVQSFDHPSEIIPGITATLHPGHTPGSAFYALNSGNQSILFVGDIIHVASVQFSDPAISITYDVDSKAAVEVRKAFFPEFATGRTLIAGPHLPFPGIGHVRAVGSGFEWVPIDYGNREIK